jgi:hypothetical protein
MLTAKREHSGGGLGAIPGEPSHRCRLLPGRRVAASSAERERWAGYRRAMAVKGYASGSERAANAESVATAAPERTEAAA